MSAQIQVKPEVNRLIKFMTQIEEGKFKIPTWQRDYLWGTKEKLELFDSISREYPIGSILLWRPKIFFSQKNEIGPYTIESYPENSESFYILDGFQRLATIFACLTNPKKTKLKVDEIKLKKEFSIYYDLEKEEFNILRNPPSEITNIPIYILIDTYEFLDYSDNLRSSINDNEKARILLERARKLSSTLIDYSLPSIEILGGDITDAVDIFSRVNSKGLKISADWMVSALTADEQLNFNLSDLFEKLEFELQEYNFEGLKREILLQCIQNSFGKIYFDLKIEDLINRSNFREITSKTIISIKRAVKFLFEELMVIDKKLLPYNNQLIFITYFFNEVQNPSQTHLEKLKKWFWITTYSNYFTIYSLSKIRIAFDQFKQFVKNESENSVYNDKPFLPFAVADFPASVNFKSVRSTALILYLLNHSNNFQSIVSSEVDSLKITFLFSGNTDIKGVIPITEYLPQFTGKLPFAYKKQKDMSYLFSNSNFLHFSDKYFLTEIMRELYLANRTQDILDIRQDLIQQHERAFVEQLGLTYVS